jgi:succinate dehydrogenase/fumarate reductase flavoprotein subunit
MPEQPWLPATWDRQADVVVVGFGAAGAATATEAAAALTPKVSSSPFTSSEASNSDKPLIDSMML